VQPTRLKVGVSTPDGGNGQWIPLNASMITQHGYSVLADQHEDEAFLAGHRDCHEYRHSVASPVGRCISVAAARHHRSAPEQVAWMLRSQP